MLLSLRSIEEDEVCGRSSEYWSGDAVRPGTVTSGPAPAKSNECTLSGMRTI